MKAQRQIRMPRVPGNIRILQGQDEESHDLQTVTEIHHEMKQLTHSGSLQNPSKVLTTMGGADVVDVFDMTHKFRGFYDMTCSRPQFSRQETRTGLVTLLNLLPPPPRIQRESRPVKAKTVRFAPKN